MTVLSLDTTTRAGSAAVLRDGRVLCELPGDARLTHGERLPRELDAALTAANVPLDEIDLLAVAVGPGSFTGLRVGIAAMQGIAMANGLRVVPVSALDALARAAGPGDGPVAAWIDAHRGQVFAAVYQGADGPALAAPSSLTPAETLQAWFSIRPACRPRFIGDGAVRYADAIRRELGQEAAILGGTPPLAGIVGTIATDHPDRAVLPHAVVPIYVRRPDAELARLKRNRTGSGDA